MFFKTLNSGLPPRIVHIGVRQVPPICVASDASLDDPAPPSMAVLIMDPVQQTRKCLLAVVPEELRRVWASETESFVAVVGLGSRCCSGRVCRCADMF